MTEENEQEQIEDLKPDEPKPDDDLEGLDDRSREIVEEARREAAKSRRELRAAQASADEERRKAEALRVEHESDQEKAVREAVEEARTEEAGKWQRQLLEAQVTARAAGKLADPGDAIHLLPVDELLAEPEETRPKKLDSMLDELLESKPYLAAENGGQASRGGELVTQGTRSQPPRKGEDASPDDWIRRQRSR